jgi:hypothetical protein
MKSTGILRRVTRVRTDDSEDIIDIIIRVTRIGELGTTPLPASPTPLSILNLPSHKTPFFAASKFIFLGIPAIILVGERITSRSY